MDRQLLPGRQRLPAEATRLVLWLGLRLRVTLLDLLPRGVLTARPLDSGLRLHLGFMELVLPNKVLQEVVSPIADVPAVIDITCPPFKVTLSQVSYSSGIARRSRLRQDMSTKGAYRWPSFS